MKFSNYNSLEYALLSWWNYLESKNNKGIWHYITKSPIFIPSYIFENDFKNMLTCWDSSDTFKQVGLWLMESGKTHLKQPDKFGRVYAYNVDVMIDKVKKIQRKALKEEELK